MTPFISNEIRLAAVDDIGTSKRAESEQLKQLQNFCHALMISVCVVSEGFVSKMSM
jgi:hypothetical protein